MQNTEYFERRYAQSSTDVGGIIARSATGARTVLLILIVFARISVADDAPRAGTTTYILVPALILGNAALLSAGPPSSSNWRGGILFDDDVRGWLKSDSQSGRKSAESVGNILLATMVAYPFIVDAVADKWVGKKDAGAALRMSLIAAQSLLATGFLRGLSGATVGRERPFQRECGGNPSYDPDCNQPASRTSFFSGHAAFSFTGAGLICSAHEAMDLFGGAIPCYGGLAVATAVSISRVVADKHYFSDVVVGAMVGLTSGYFIPKLLHYGESKVALIPTTAPDRIGLTMALSL